MTQALIFFEQDALFDKKKFKSEKNLFSPHEDSPIFSKGLGQPLPLSDFASVVFISILTPNESLILKSRKV